MLLPVIVIIICKILWDAYRVSLRGPYGLFTIPLFGCPLLVLLTVGLAILAFVISGVLQARSIAPALVVGIGIVLTLQIPEPQAPVTPEETSFLEHREDYEHVVDLARSGALVRAPSTNPGAYLLPSDANIFSVALRVYVRTGTPFVVEFSPFDSYHPLVYVEGWQNDSRGESCYSRGEPWIEKRLDEHWFVCVYEWN